MENHNSSRSNKTYPGAPPGPGNVFIACPAEVPFSTLQTMADQIQMEIDKHQIDKTVRSIIEKNGARGINNIVCEVRILLVRGLWAAAAARETLLADEPRLLEVGIKEGGVK